MSQNIPNIELKEKLQKIAEQAHLNIGGKSVVCASVGSGKSKIAINRISEHFRKNKYSRILFTGARQVYINTFKRELKKFGMEKYISSIDFCCVASLKNYTKTQYNLIVVDECHIDTKRIVSFINHYRKGNCEILMLTGTPPPENSVVGKVLYSICPISYRKALDDSIAVDLVNDYRIHILYHDLDDKNKYLSIGNTKDKTEKEKYQHLYKMYLRVIDKQHRGGKFPFAIVLLKHFFNNLVSKRDAAVKLSKTLKGKTLIYAGSIEQAESMSIPTYHSKLSKNERESNLTAFIEGKIQMLCNVAGIRESANIPHLKYGVILAPDASKNNFEQSVGRFSRLVIGETAHIFVLCAKGTIEEVWLNSAIKQLDTTKIDKVNFKDFEDIY